METSLFDYTLPPERIAQEPASPRDSARLLCVRRGTSDFQHRRACDLPELLRAGDVLVLNHSRVIPARLFAHGENGRRFELLLLEEAADDGLWSALVRPGKLARPGTRLIINDDPHHTLFVSEVVDRLPDGIVLLKFNLTGAAFQQALLEFGHIPTPPYIQKELRDPAQYQTVYAHPDKPGSVAAPTAGLHFTQELLERLAAMGVTLEYVTLHVGLGTFQPIRTEQVEEHRIHAERFEVAPGVARRLSRAQQEGRRIIAVGTTSARVLETIGNWPAIGKANEVLDTDDPATFPGLTGSTEIFIYPGYTWKVVDGLLTNFHLPRTSLLALVASFLADPTRPEEGVKLMQRAYMEALARSYRFYSFGDAMLIL